MVNGSAISCNVNADVNGNARDILQRAAQLVISCATILSMTI